MANVHIRDLIWDSLFMAEVRARYFSRVAGSLRAWERYLALFVAVSSSGAVATVLTNAKVWSVVLSIVAAIVAAVLATFKFDKRVSVGASLSRQWLEIASEYEILWARLGDTTESEALEVHRRLEKKHFPMDELAMSEFQLKAKLLDACFDEIKTSHGLQEAA